MKKVLLLFFAALVIPSVALAAKPAKPAPPQVTYELKGTLSNYMAYDSVTPANGHVTIVVSSANMHGKALKGQSLTFALDSHTAVMLKKGLSTVTDGDRGMIRVRAAAHTAPANLLATLQASAAMSVNDHGVKPIPMAMYTLRGTLSAYHAYDSVTPANGMVTIVVKNARPHGKSLKGATLTIPIDVKTKVRLTHKLTTITDGDKGLIKVRAPKKPADLAAALQASSAKLVIDQGAPKPKH